MPLSFDIGAQSNAPVPPAQPAQGVSVAPRPTGTAASDQGVADQVGAIVTGGTFDGLSLSYNGTTRAISGTNTDKGSTAVAAHEAELDPHPQYHTSAEVADDIAAHSAAVDPHGDRAYADSGDAATAAAAAAALAATELGDLADVDLTGATAGDALVFDGTNWLPVAGGGGGGGVTDHGALTGLADDDHPQYHDDARGDARYLQLSGGTLSGQVFYSTESTSGAGFIARVYSDGNPGSMGVNAQRFRGTLATPAVVEAGDLLGSFGAQGYANTGVSIGLSGIVGQVRVEAAEQFSASAMGTRMSFRTTPIGSTSPANALGVGPSGELEVSTGKDPGAAGQVLTSQGAGSPPTWSSPGDGWTYVVMGADEVWSSNVSYTHLVSLEFLAAAAGTYLVEWTVIYSTSATSSLPRFTLVRPATSVTLSIRLFTTPGTGTPSSIWHSMTSAQVYTPSGTAPSLEPLLLQGGGLVIAGGAMSGAGIRISGGPELAGQSVTVKAGSLLRWRKVA